MIRISGFAWNHMRQCMEVDNTMVWEEYERTHKGMSGMNGKAFPIPMYASGESMFPDGIFVELTNGDPIGNPFTPNPIVNPSTPRANGNPSTPRANDNPSTQRGNGNPSTPVANIPVPERPKKLAKLDALNEMMKGFIAQNNAHMKKMTNAMGKVHMSNKATTLEVKEGKAKEVGEGKVEEGGEGKAEHLDEALGQLVHPLEHLHLNLSPNIGLQKLKTQSLFSFCLY
ncbi:hypothetical protein Acr_04g0001080 [Actinidia rufa]|uniref:Uncharacterized protein n=1 Tax=Actinidia rufa TaxID=165716 RepID=A0A7J0EG57_9ERIC|nr:hypothetical protein Acr_04g0001080 [Actinidia rufa]